MSVNKKTNNNIQISVSDVIYNSNDSAITELEQSHNDYVFLYLIRFGSGYNGSM